MKQPKCQARHPLLLQPSSNNIRRGRLAGQTNVSASTATKWGMSPLIVDSGSGTASKAVASVGVADAMECGIAWGAMGSNTNSPSSHSRRTVSRPSNLVRQRWCQRSTS